MFRQNRFQAHDNMFLAGALSVNLMMLGIINMALLSLLMAFHILNTGSTLPIMPIGGGGLILPPSSPDKMRPSLRQSSHVPKAVLLRVALIIIKGRILSALQGTTQLIPISRLTVSVHSARSVRLKVDISLQLGHYRVGRLLLIPIYNRRTLFHLSQLLSRKQSLRRVLRNIRARLNIPVARLLRFRAGVIIRLVRRVHLQDRTTDHLNSRNITHNLVPFRDQIVTLRRQRVPCTGTIRNSRANLTAGAMLNIVTASGRQRERTILFSSQSQGTTMPPDNVRILLLPLYKGMRFIMRGVLRRNRAREQLTPNRNALQNRITSIFPLIFTSLMIRRHTASRVPTVFELRGTGRVMNALCTFKKGNRIVIRGRGIHNLQFLLRNNSRTPNRSTNPASVVIQGRLGAVITRLLHVRYTPVVRRVRIRVLNSKVAQISSLILSRASIPFSRHFLFRHNHKRRRLCIIRHHANLGGMVTVTGNRHPFNLRRGARSRRVIHSFRQRISNLPVIEDRRFQKGALGKGQAVHRHVTRNLLRLTYHALRLGIRHRLNHDNMLPRLRRKRKVRVHTRVGNSNANRHPLTGVIIGRSKVIKAAMRQQVNSEAEVNLRGSVHGFRDQRSAAASSFSNHCFSVRRGGYAGPASVVVIIRFHHFPSQPHPGPHRQYHKNHGHHQSLDQVATSRNVSQQCST